MRVQHIGYGARGFYRIAGLGRRWDMTPQDAQRRLQILHFLDEHGLEAPLDAFGVSSRTLYRWKATLKAQGGNPAALAAQSSAPKQRRTPQTDARLVAENRRLRTLYPKLVKAKLDVLLAPWCVQHGITLASVSTLGRIIARAPDKMRQTLARLNSLGQRKPLRRNLKPRKPQNANSSPLEVLASDTIERIRDGLRRYIVTFIDPVSYFAFAWATPSKHARHTARALQWDLTVLPQTPKTPKMNAHAERFNRTIQESFVDYHEDLLFTDLALFNQKLADSLVFYDTQRPHHCLGQKSPLSFLIQHQPECQRCWTHTPVQGYRIRKCRRR
ncbi:transposase [Zoogloeaceae bacteirum Par-f-2]|uniref:integrase core domain-containing protein n=1 Tax=Pseudothauera hydrothermalis TaxID=2184083 RepID=UPI000D255C07|nr:integrase core domain-containing protein [Pseudothauera hydrothermalis]AVZ80009.1 transposase [Zoogloeaceae bacteirum Par-f-2]